jgi:hypothetical protein
MTNYKKIEEFTPICMLANQNEIQEIVSIFKKLDLGVLSTKTDDANPYLINWYENDDKLGLGTYNNNIGAKVYETFDKETFLKACGIVEDNSNSNIDLSKLTPELITELCRDEKIKEVMINNGVVKNELEDNTYYIFENGALQFNVKDGKGYGICAYKTWCNECEWVSHSHNGKFRKATPQEVETALKNEAVKKQYENNHIICIAGQIGSKSCQKLVNGKFVYSGFSNTLIYQMENGCYTIFNNGIWAKTYPQEETYIKIPLSIITLTDSDKKLGKIVKNLSKNV